MIKWADLLKEVNRFIVFSKIFLVVSIFLGAATCTATIGLFLFGKFLQGFICLIGTVSIVINCVNTHDQIKGSYDMVDVILSGMRVYPDE